MKIVNPQLVILWKADANRLLAYKELALPTEVQPSGELQQSVTVRCWRCIKEFTVGDLLIRYEKTTDEHDISWTSRAFVFCPGCAQEGWLQPFYVPYYLGSHSDGFTFVDQKGFEDYKRKPEKEGDADENKPSLWYVDVEWITPPIGEECDPFTSPPDK